MSISIKEHSTVRYLELGQFQLNRLLIKFYDKQVEAGLDFQAAVLS
jgi:hypothetical protein